MSDSEEPETPEPSYIFYKDREEWKDLVPMKQDDGPSPVVRIGYSKRFVDVHDYFRGVMQIGDKSERVLQLTADALDLNAANYTVWQYRRDVLEALNIRSLITQDGIPIPFDAEFKFASDMIEENQKNYQVWHHRKMLVSWLVGYNEETGELALKDPESRQVVVGQELELTERMLAKDGKNYHAWQYRQWILSIFQAFEGELPYLAFLLEEDVRNNSAWNQRYFVLKNSPDIKITAGLVQEEIEYTWGQILKAPSNESPWNYLRGVYKLSAEVRLADDDAILSKCSKLLASGSKSIHLLSFMLCIYEERLLVDRAGPTEYNHALEICTKLEKDIDKIRCAYWRYMKNKFETQFGSRMGPTVEPVTVT